MMPLRLPSHALKRHGFLIVLNGTKNLFAKQLSGYRQKIKKPVLKLTNHDYMEHGMGDIITEFGSAYQVNIKVFNFLQHTITGWPGGKPNADDSHRPETSKAISETCCYFLTASR